jgi:hypothetical protein
MAGEIATDVDITLDEVEHTRESCLPRLFNYLSQVWFSYRLSG